MNCKEAEKLILPYIRNELPDELTVPFIAHVRSCSECYDEFEIFYTIRHLLQSDEAVRTGTASISEEESYDIRQLIENDFESRLTKIRKAAKRKKMAYVGIAIGVLILAVLILLILYPDEAIRWFYQVLEFLTDWGLGER
ncbi:MAG: zf-HC2 domain-containing protein [Lachnospiraceae bacterium]|nr:zf-HC2 domain-containing protein [Lachnospiraceae bacterium]